MLYYQHAHVLTIWVDPVVMQIPGNPLLVDIRLCISCRHLLHYTHSTPSLKKKQTAARLQESCISAKGIVSNHQYYQLPAGYRTFALWVDISGLTFLKVTAQEFTYMYVYIEGCCWYFFLIFMAVDEQYSQQDLVQSCPLCVDSLMLKLPQASSQNVNR